MTWAKFGAEYRDECAEAGLSDAAFRTHSEALMYLYGVESADMRIQRRLVRKWAGSEDYERAISELVARGWWVVDGDGWRVVHHALVFRQSLAAQQKKRDTERNRQRTKRQTRPASVGTNVGTNTAANVGPTQTDRQTEALTDRPGTSTPSAPADDWPDVATPGRTTPRSRSRTTSTATASARWVCVDCGAPTGPNRHRCAACMRGGPR